MVGKHLRLPFVDPESFDKWAVFDKIEYIPDEWQDYFHASEARNRLLGSGVRVGKTFAAGGEGTAAALKPSPKSYEANEWVGSRGWVVGNNYDTADKVFRLIWQNLARHYPWMICKGSREHDRIIRTPGGGFVAAKSAENKDSLIGEELDWAIIDEASRVGEWEKEEVKQRLITRDGWLACISSPTSRRWFQEEFDLGQRNGVHYEWVGEPLDGYEYAGREVRFIDNSLKRGFDEELKDYFSIRVPTHANTRLNVQILADWERRMPNRIFRQDVLGEFMSAQGAVFRDFARLCTAEPLKRAVPGARYVMGWDVARVRDYSVVTVLDLWARRQVFLDRFRGSWTEQYDRVESIARRFPTLEKVGKRTVVEALPELAIDSTGKGDAVAEELERRNDESEDPFLAEVHRVEISTNKKKRDLVESVVVAVDQAEIELLNDPVQNQEMRLFEYKESETTGAIRYGAPSGYNDDTVLALCLAWVLAGEPLGTAEIIMG